MVEVWHDWRWEKRNRTNFYRVMLLVCISSIQFGTFWYKNYTQGIYIVQKSLWISSHFGTESYTWRLDIVQNFSCLIFRHILSQNIY